MDNQQIRSMFFLVLCLVFAILMAIVSSQTVVLSPSSTFDGFKVSLKLFDRKRHFFKGDLIEFQRMYKKNYSTPTEHRLRASVYADNQKYIHAHNRRFLLKQVSYRLEMNKFRDMLPSEFAETMTGYKLK
jgi:hypothetical protein